ncbi:MAG: hypothetical protein ACTSPI_17010 [Candidatus Heimdallarchaeaceae archaeon]
MSGWIEKTFKVGDIFQVGKDICMIVQLAKNKVALVSLNRGSLDSNEDRGCLKSIIVEVKDDTQITFKELQFLSSSFFMFLADAEIKVLYSVHLNFP